MNIKLVNKILIYTLLVFSVFAFATHPTSNAKYFDKKDNVLTYTNKIKKMYANDIIISLEDTSTYDTAVFNFNFNRSSNMKPSDKKVTYDISINKNCKIVAINNKETNDTSVSFTSVGEKQTTIKYSCKVNDLKEDGVDLQGNNLVYITNTVNITETFTNSTGAKEKYKFATGTYKASLQAYRDNHPHITISDDGLTLILNDDEDNKYKSFDLWINNYIEKYITDSREIDAINKYVKTAFNNDNDVITANLKGIKRTYDSTRGEYTFVIEGNFLSYAKTYFASLEGNINMYFVGDNISDSEFDEAFEYYIRTYTTYSVADQNKILDYIKSFGGAHVVKTRTIGGLIYYPNTSQLKLADNIMTYIDNMNAPAIKIDYAEVADMYQQFYQSLAAKYSSFISSEDAVKRWGLRTTITKKTEFDVYVVKQDYVNKNYILIHLYSDVANNCNYAQAYDLGTTQTSLVYENGTATFTITDTNKDNIISVLEKLDSYFGENYVDALDPTIFDESKTSGNVTSTINGSTIQIVVIYYPNN